MSCKALLYVPVCPARCTSTKAASRLASGRGPVSFLPTGASTRSPLARMPRGFHFVHMASASLLMVALRHPSRHHPPRCPTTSVGVGARLTLTYCVLIHAVVSHRHSVPRSSRGHGRALATRRSPWHLTELLHEIGFQGAAGVEHPMRDFGNASGKGVATREEKVCESPKAPHRTHATVTCIEPTWPSCSLARVATACIVRQAAEVTAPSA